MMANAAMRRASCRALPRRSRRATTTEHSAPPMECCTRAGVHDQVRPCSIKSRGHLGNLERVAALRQGQCGDLGHGLRVPRSSRALPDERKAAARRRQTLYYFGGAQGHPGIMPRVRDVQRLRYRSVADTSSWVLPASNAEWPASGTIRKSASGHARCKSQALFAGHTTS